MQIHSLDHPVAYDYVVYGASVGGILLALHHATAGQKVLVLNSYGFPGGSITESLSCLQQWPEAAAPHARELLGELRANPYATVYDGPEGWVLNPEVLKISLQRALEASPVSLLFHVKAQRLGPPDPAGYSALHLIGKEGALQVRGRCIIDATEAGYLARIVRGAGQPNEARLCVFTSPLPAAAEPAVRGLPNLAQAVRLPDGRYWLALGLPAAGQTQVETAANDLLDALTLALAPLGGRLQIVPAETQLLYQPAPAAPAAVPFYHVADLLPGRRYAPTQALQQAADLEAAVARAGVAV